MGNSQSNEISEEYTKYIEEQKKIIESQQNQINRLARLNTRETPKQTVTKKPHKKQMKNDEKIDFILKLFELDKNYDENSLKKGYLKLALKHHPDKGGDDENFRKITQAYQFLLKKLGEKDSLKSHNDLKTENEEFTRNQMSDNRKNVNLSDKFDRNVFNKIYEENRQENNFDSGYEKWIEENKLTSDKIERGDVSKNNFHQKFQEKKKKQMKGEIVNYEGPQVSISFRGKDSLVTLGDDKVVDFSGESSSGLQYRDYRDAFSNSHLIDVSSVDISHRSKTIRQANTERKSISYEMSQEDLEKQKKIQIMEEKREEERVKRLQQSDQSAFSTYDAIHQRMLGR